MTATNKAKRIVHSIETQARNLLVLHRIGIGNGRVSVSVETAHRLLVAMGQLIASRVLEIMDGCPECKTKVHDEFGEPPNA